MFTTCVQIVSDSQLLLWMKSQVFNFTRAREKCQGCQFNLIFEKFNQDSQVESKNCDTDSEWLTTFALNDSQEIDFSRARAKCQERECYLILSVHWSVVAQVMKALPFSASLSFCIVFCRLDEEIWEGRFVTPLENKGKFYLFWRIPNYRYSTE